MDEAPGRKGLRPSRHRRPARAPAGAHPEGCRRALSAPGILLRRLAWIPDRSHLHGPELSGRKRVAWTRPLDLDVVKQANRRLGATVNDVLMASVAGAFSHYLEDHGGAAPSRFLVSMPVNVRDLAKSLRCDNYFAPVPLELPAGPPASGPPHPGGEGADGPAEMLGRAHGHLPSAAGPGQLPAPGREPAASSTSSPTSARPWSPTSRAPSRELTLEGRKVRSIIFWVPQRARIGVGISILSFSGKVQVGVIADEVLVPDPAVLVQAFEDEFDTLKMLASLAPGQPELPPEAAPKPEVQRVRRRSPRPKTKPKAGPPAGEEKLQEPLTEGPIMSFRMRPWVRRRFR